MSDHVTEVSELVAAVEAGFKKAVHYSEVCTGEMMRGYVHEDITEGREAFTAILTALESATDENRKLRELARNVTEQAHIAQEDYDQHKTVNDQCRAFRLGYNMLMSLSTQAAEALAGSAAVDEEAGKL